MKPERKAYLHEISTNEELDFLIRWMRVLFQRYPNIRGEINGISINLTGKYVGIDQAQTISIEKVEGWNE